MAFKRYKGKTKVMYFPVKTSTAFTAGDLVVWGTGGDAGLIIPATSATTKNLGVIKKTIASTDSDYATARLVPVEVPVEKYVEWVADVTSGLVVGDIGLYVDLTDARTVDRAASTVDALLCTGVISSTKGTFVIADSADYNN